MTKLGNEETAIKMENIMNEPSQKPKALYHVAQVNDAWICSEKGYGTVTLFDDSSVQFVIGKDWRINGCKLVLRRHLTKHREATNEKQLTQRQRGSDIRPQNETRTTQPFQYYTDYQKKRPSFWLDVPHSDSKMVQPTKHRKLQDFWRKTTIQTCQKKTQKPRRTHKRRKPPQTSAAHMYGTAGDWTFSVPYPCSEIESQSRNVKDEQTVNVSCRKHATSENKTPETCSELQSEELITPESSSCPEVAIDVDSTQCLPTRPHSNVSSVPVYVHSNGKKYTSCVDTSKPFVSLREEILRSEGIPQHHQLLMYKGKVITSDQCLKSLQPHDRVEVIVKARGGMLTDATISPTSTEEEVTEWLRNVVKVQEETVTKCEEVDGQMLFAYHENDCRTFSSDNDITLGQAIRIFVYRNSAQYRGEGTQVAHWTVHELSNFINETLKVKKDFAATLCDYVIQHTIDGVVILQYQNENDFKQGFPNLCVPTGILKKIFMKLENRIKDDMAAKTGDTMFDQPACDRGVEPPHDKSVRVSTTDTTPTVADQEQPYSVNPVVHTSTEILTEAECDLSVDRTTTCSVLPKASVDKQTTHPGGNGAKYSSPTTEELAHLPMDSVLRQFSSIGLEADTKINEYFTFIEKTLHLRNCISGGRESCCPCQLRVITYTSHQQNALQKQLLFFVLHRKDDLATSEAQKGFWGQIAKDPMMWLKGRLSASEQNSIQLTNSDDKIKIRGEVCSLRGLNITMKYIMDKELRTTLDFQNHILLVNRHILQANTEGYTFQLETQKKRKSPVTYHFTFSQDKTYFLFDSDDYAFQFQNINIEQCKLGTLQPRDGSIALPPEDTQSSNSVDPIISTGNTLWELNEIHVPTQIPIQQEIMKIQNDSNLPIIKGFQKQESYIDLSCSKDKRTPCVADTVPSQSKEPTCDSIQDNRSFGKSSASIVYREGSLLSEFENAGSTSGRCIMYKSICETFEWRSETALMSEIISEYLAFACGCLNARRNGTIYFGIGSRSTNQRNEVVGVILDLKRDRQFISDCLREAVKKSFNEHAAHNCIHSPVFVQVALNEASLQTFVMEIDIEPKSTICNDIFFKIALPVGYGRHDTEQEALGYVLDGLRNEQLRGKASETLFTLTTLKDNIQERQRTEQMQATRHVVEPAVGKLRRLLSGGEEMLKLSMWYGLILTCPTLQQKMSDEWKNHLTFIKRMPFTAVFDFDDESNKNGLCKYLRNPEKSQLQTWLVFSENAGKYDALQSILKTPYGDIWVFCNGRSDSSPRYDHLKRCEWTLRYQRGASHAIDFLNYSIPEGRLFILILLLSNDFEGVIDTFYEIISRFGWEHILVIAEDTTIFDEFSKSIVLEQKGTKSQLDDRSVVGISWEEINITINEITGHTEYGCCVIPTAGGAFVPLEEKIIETLNDLEILSAKQCEKTTFENDNQRRDFSRKHEVEFYKGNKVTWWNFYFKTHVMERNNFLRLRETLSNILSVQLHDTKVVTVILNHEPGAGGSTLGRHLLWDFRQKYRCAIVKKLTERTYKNVMFLHRVHDDSSDVKPLLLLVDDVPQSDYNSDELARKISTESRNQQNCNGLVCCILVLQREDTIISEPKPFTSETKYVEYLKQKCFEAEIYWLKEKCLELEKRDDFGSDFRPEHLISFMILRQDFKEEYIEKTVHHLMGSLNIESSEFKLLKYTSLICAYTPTSRFGYKPSIPLECCDSLMVLHNTNTKDYNVWWERQLSSTIKIFLVIEEKENASGMQIRISHAKLAKVVLKDILRIQNLSLSSLVEEFLNCSLFDSSTYGKTDLIETTKEILKRRKKEEYDDDVNTMFSPLIEDIKSSEDSSGSKGPTAAQILIMGFEKFDDAMIAQSLARLYTKQKQYDDGIKWATKAVELSPKAGYSYCTHTLGYVLKSKFTNETNPLTDLDPRESTRYLTVIFRSLDLFQEASRDRSTMYNHNYLYAFIDTIGTINMICRFIKTSVDLSVGFDLAKYLADGDYIPPEVKEPWADLHLGFKSLKRIGDIVFEKLEDHVSFNTTHYAHSTVEGRSEHRSCRLLKHKYPAMLSDYSLCFGEMRDKPPDHLHGELRNTWHRRRILSLQGHTYWGIFNNRTINETNDEQSTKRTYQRRLEKIKKHLDTITEKDTKDLSNSVCVSFALGLLDVKNRASNGEMYQMCKDVIDLGKDRLDVAHFFVTMFMWPTSNMNIEYDDDAFKKSFKFLSDKSKRSQRQIKQKNTNHFLKEEKTVFQPSTQFFLTKYDGLKSVCHKRDIYFRERNERHVKQDDFWEHPNIKKRLKRLKGQLCFGHDGVNPYILTENPETPGQCIEIRRMRSGGREFYSEEEVMFYVGFSIAGPIAYNVTPSRHEEDPSLLTLRLPPPSKIDKYTKSETSELQGFLQKIKEIRQKQPARRKEREKNLLGDAEDIQTALDIKLGRTPDDFHH